MCKSTILEICSGLQESNEIELCCYLQADLVGVADIAHLMLFGEHIQVYQENSIWKISQNVSK